MKQSMQHSKSSRASEKLEHIGRPAGFTLIEMLGVTILIIILISLMLPAVQQVREAARRSECRNNLMQIGIAMNNYQMAYDVLPPGTQNAVGPIKSIEGGGYHMGWMTQILPYLEQQNVYDKIDFTKSAYDLANAPVRFHKVTTFICRSEPSGNLVKGLTNYCAIHNDVDSEIDVDQNGVLFLNSAVRQDDIRDGVSNTMFVVETKMDARSALGWISGTRSSLRNAVIAVSDDANSRDSNGRETMYRLYSSALPANFPTNLVAGMEVDNGQVGGPSSWHYGGSIQALIGDGSVRVISPSIDASVLRKMAHRSDGEMADEI